MTTLKITLDAKTPALTNGADQIPFALQAAINESLKKAQAKQRAHDAQVFTIRRKTFVDNSVKITQFAKKSTLVGEIAMDPPGNKSDDLFTKFEKRTIKKPIDGHNLAIPILGSPIKRSARVVIKDQDRPKALLSGATKVTTGAGKTKDVKRGKRFLGAFLKPAEKGHPAEIFLRLGKQIKPVYVLRPYAPIKPVLQFEQIVTAEVQRVFSSEFEKAFAHAIATARKR